MAGNPHPLVAMFGVYVMGTVKGTVKEGTYYNDILGQKALQDMYIDRYAFRPVVTLNSSLQIDTMDSSRDGSSIEKAWVLK